MAASLRKILWNPQTGLLPYPQGLAMMETALREITAGRAPSQFLLLEHESVYTAGSSSQPEELFNPRRYPVHYTGRGGKWTYHGPGQRIIYALLDLNQPHGALPSRDIHALVRSLEHWIIAALKRLGLKSFTAPSRTGVWVHDPADGQEKKIAAIGLRVSKWVSWHGVSLNLNPDLEAFNGIVPCGLTGYETASLKALGFSTTMAELDQALFATAPDFFGPVSGKPRLAMKGTSTFPPPCADTTLPGQA